MAQLPIHEAIGVACAGINQTTLGKAVGVEQSTISRWIRGEIRPSFEKLMSLEVAAGRPRGFVLRLAGMIDDEVSARHALDQDDALSAEARSILVAAYDAAVGAANPAVARMDFSLGPEHRPSNSHHGA